MCGKIGQERDFSKLNKGLYCPKPCVDKAFKAITSHIQTCDVCSKTMDVDKLEFPTTRNGKTFCYDCYKHSL